jgi:hypothetical protein
MLVGCGWQGSREPFPSVSFVCICSNRVSAGSREPLWAGSVQLCAGLMYPLFALAEMISGTSSAAGLHFKEEFSWGWASRLCADSRESAPASASSSSGLCLARRLTTNRKDSAPIGSRELFGVGFGQLPRVGVAMFCGVQGGGWGLSLARVVVCAWVFGMRGTGGTGGTSEIGSMRGIGSWRGAVCGTVLLDALGCHLSLMVATLLIHHGSLGP